MYKLLFLGVSCGWCIGFTVYFFLTMTTAFRVTFD